MTATAIGPLFPLAEAGELMDKARELPEPWDEARWISSARTGIAVALQDCGMDNGEVVWVPSYFTPAMTAPIEHVGCRVRFYPLTESLEIDVGALRRLFTLDIRGLIAPHFFGFPQQAFGDLRKFCSERSIFILEDCAHGLLGKFDGKRFGELGDYAIASLTKCFGVKEGGLLASHHGRVDATVYPAGVKRELAAWPEIIAETLRWGRKAPPQPLLSRLGGGKSDATVAVRPTPHALVDEADGAQSRPFSDDFMTQNVARATRDVVLRTDLNAMARRRRSTYEYYLESALGWKHARPLFPRLPDGVVPYMFPLELKMPAQQYPALLAKGVPMVRWDYAHADLPSGLCPVGTRYAKSLIHLPLHQSLTDEESERISHALFDVLR
jgi:dTDP-4-amino-4,6-dideoxygalactose transaminase